MATLLTHPERVAIARLHALLELLPTALDKRLGSAGVTAFEFTLLDALADAEGQRMRLSALARKTNATLPRLSRVVTSLERRDLIERAPCLEDGRAVNAVMTAKGAEVREAASALYGAAVKDLVFDGLSEVDGDGVSQLTDLTYAILKTMDPNASASLDEAAGGGLGGSELGGGAGLCAADPAGAGVVGALGADGAAEALCAADPVEVAAELPCAADPVVSA